ncbi:hypothetical protein [Spirosoma sp.]|uniref:hypothetical protein n=1 Tax=Spirosoma sp. TaxID=1899569 RepID=UPI00260E9ACC|nr:hypothetical protein [Spirosoma sp.]MCX6219257.1 hypothetical protein [Spirosoma sp.]
MLNNQEETQLASALTHDINDALNRRIEERFRAALFLADPELNMDSVVVVSNVENDNELTVDGVDDETIDKAMAIFESQPE